MSAVIRQGGRQFRVSEGDIVLIDRVDTEKGETLTFDQVLARGDEIGTPLVSGAKVTAEVLEPLVKDKKVYTLKYRRRKASSKSLKGHRQQYTRVRVKSIS